MPSPFPGMDPYLEGSLWMSVHTDLAVAIAHQLNHRMSSRYVALTARRYVVDTPEEAGVLIGEVYPDAAVLTPHITVEIRDLAKRRLVIAIEVLSPTNKRGEG